MIPKIEVLPEKKLVGMSKVMTIQQDRTRELWQSFGSKKHMIEGRTDEWLYSLQVYGDFKSFTTQTEFEKWAAVEVSEEHEEIEGFKNYTLRGGMYAVFLHNGPASTFVQTLHYIFEKWLPTSGYEYDNREHFERFDQHYSPTDPNAVEEVWIPIKLPNEEERE